MKKEKQPANKKNSEWPETLSKSCATLLSETRWIITELYNGFRHGTIPAGTLLLCSLPIAIILFFRLDVLAINHTRFSFLYPYNQLYWIYAELFFFSPWIFWAWGRSIALRRFLKALTTTFYDASLVTSMGRIPQFISDHSIDESVREVKLSMNGNPLSAFEAARERLSEVFGHIEKIETQGHSIVTIQYALTALPTNFPIYDIPQVSEPATFAIGKTRSGLLTVSLIEVPHFLIGGRTRSGKSTLVRQIIATLLAYNPELRVYFIDLKYLLEGNAFDVDGRLPKRMQILGSVSQALEILELAAERIKARAEFLVLNRCSNIERFQKLSPNDIKWTKEIRNREAIYREVYVIDEAAELFLSGADADVKQAQRAKRLAIGIAAKGRAVGIHLIVATQRPDKSVVDMQIKTNLIGRICFHMTDNASSMTILDNTRAAQLPNVAGRVIFRDGGIQKEVQALHLGEDDLKAVLKNRNMLEDEVPTKNASESTETNTATSTLKNPQETHSEKDATSQSRSSTSVTRVNR
jgi:S-DNA-T family DNA segregation ATPase FtsK/SpoIIIE